MNKEDKELLDASQIGSLERIRQILQAGAHINVQDPAGLSAFHHAIRNNHIPVIEYLIGYPEVNLIIQDKYGYSILHEAVKRRSICAVKLLLESGIEVNITNNDDQVPYQLAVSYTQWLHDPIILEQYHTIIALFEEHETLKRAVINNF